MNQDRVIPLAAIDVSKLLKIEIKRLSLISLYQKKSSVSSVLVQLTIPICAFIVLLLFVANVLKYIKIRFSLLF